LATSSPAFPIDPNSDLSARIQQLASDDRWQEIVDQLHSIAPRDAELEFYYGSALAHVGRLQDARNELLLGRRRAPNDARFATELAGIAFKQKNYAAASRWMRRALRLNPSDSYAYDFLGTVYLLEGNLEAALKFWNHIGKPYLESVTPAQALKIRPALLDRALAFSPAAELRLPNLETTRVRLEGLGVFPDPRIQLIARSDGKFDAVLQLEERNRWGNNAWEALISIFRGVGYETIYPEYDNIRGSAINVSSLVRWDSQKRRLSAVLSSPLHQNPKWRYWLGVDLRNENWDIRDSFTGPAPTLGALNLRRESASIGFDSFNSGRWSWSASAEFSHRDYRSVVAGSVLTPSLLLDGPQLKQISQIHYTPVLLPEHRFTIRTTGSFQVARIWSTSPQAFAVLQGDLRMQWSPQSQGDDYFLQSRIRGGGTAGQPPFDELFMLGMERDNDLWMRAHVGTRDGRKGSAPLGRRYFLLNNEIDKNVYGNGLIAVKLSPFLDSGKITDPSLNLGSLKWLWDTGLQAKIRVLGVGFAFVYGKDLRSGNNAYYFTAGK
jgi:tetratricopeptide (TPR) repeat protein